MNLKSFLQPLISVILPLMNINKTLAVEKDTDGFSLSRLIKAGAVDEARHHAKVQNLTIEVLSYAGHLTVNEDCDAKLFFWFFPSAYDFQNDPLILWHGGGPGSSGLLGLFNENGPFYVDVGGRLYRRKISWSLSRSVLYLDSPVGTGFSSGKETEECLVRDTTTAASHVHEALVQFYQMFQDLKKVPLYIFTGSYGGKFGPAIAYSIHKGNENESNLKIPLKGIAIGSGFMDPISQIDYGEFYFGLGLIDSMARDYFRDRQAKAKAMINDGNWTMAFDIIEPLVIGLQEESSLLKNLTGISFPYNMEKNYQGIPSSFTTFIGYLNKPEVRDALHIPSDFRRFKMDSDDVYRNFRGDIYRSVKPIILQLLNSDFYSFLFISNQLDLIVPHTSVYNFLEALNWKNADDLRQCRSKIFRASIEGEKDPIVAGYVRSVPRLTHLHLRNTGHIWVRDQPDIGLDVMKRFTSDVPFV